MFFVAPVDDASGVRRAKSVGDAAVDVACAEVERTRAAKERAESAIERMKAAAKQMEEAGCPLEGLHYNTDKVSADYEAACKAAIEAVSRRTDAVIAAEKLETKADRIRKRMRWVAESDAKATAAMVERIGERKRRYASDYKAAEDDAAKKARA